MLQAHADLVDPSKLLPWEEGRISPLDDKKLGKFRKPILRLLHRDATMRVTARQFSEDVQALFADNQESGVIPNLSDPLSGAQGAAQSSDAAEASGGSLRPNSLGLRHSAVNNPLTL